MGVGVAPRLDSLYLSKGVNFLRNVRLGKEYAATAKAKIVITDEAGIELASWDGTVNKSQAEFNNIAGADDIPHGARFELSLLEDDGDFIKLAYGIVVRGDHRYPLIPTADTTNYALQFSDTFDRKYVGKYWVGRSGSNAISIHDNLFNLPNTLGPNFSFFTDSAALWYTPLNSDSVTITVSMINMGAGKCTVVLCSDYSMSSWLGVQFETGLVNNKARIVRGTAPTKWEIVPGSTAVNSSVNNGDNYTIKFNAQTKTVSCYENAILNPLISWKDTGGLIPIGAGFRYTGFCWNTSLLAPGAEPSSWSAKDGV